MVIRHFGGRQIEDKYLGKPSVNAINRFQALARKPDVVSVWVKEFDKKTVVGERFYAGPSERIEFASVTTTLTGYYHPFWLASWVPGARGRFSSHKIAGHWVYATSPPNLTEIDTHTRWLRREGFPST